MPSEVLAEDASLIRLLRIAELGGYFDRKEGG